MSICEIDIRTGKKLVRDAAAREKAKKEAAAK